MVLPSASVRPRRNQLLSLALVAVGVRLLRSRFMVSQASFVGASAAAGSRQLDKTALRARKFIIGGNWKANGSPDSVKQLIEELNAADLEVQAGKDVEVVCAPPFVYLSEVQGALR